MRSDANILESSWRDAIQGANPSNPSAVIAIFLKKFPMCKTGLWICVQFGINIGDNGVQPADATMSS